MQSPERLRLLLVLTVVDIRAVGPGVWNEWKRTLLRTLFEAAEERLRLGHKQHGRTELVDARQEELASALGWKASALRAHGKRLPDSYWLAEPLAWQAANARQVAEAEARIGDAEPSVIAEDDAESGATRVSVFTPDREACSTGFARASRRREPISSTPESTPLATGWRSIICWSSMAREKPMPIAGSAGGW